MKELPVLRVVFLLWFSLLISTSRNRVDGRTLPEEIRLDRDKSRFLTLPPRDLGPTYVDINLHMHAIPEVNVRTMELSVVLTLRQRWHDARLQRNETDSPDSAHATQNWLSKDIWTPDVYFLNARAGILHQVTRPNEMIWIHNNGVVIYSQKLTLRLFCHMTFWNFPMDTQSCSILIGSYGHTKQELEIRWWNTKHHHFAKEHIGPVLWYLAVETNDELGLSVFKHPIYAFRNCNSSSFVMGVFSCLELELRLVRKYGFYIIYAYLPSSLVVLIAWLAFLVDPRAVPARVSLGLLSVIALIMHNASLLVHLPNVSYIKAIDLWFFVCLAFVATTLAESTLADRMSTYAARQKRNQLSQPRPGIWAWLCDCKKPRSVSPEETTSTGAQPVTTVVPLQLDEIKCDISPRLMDKVFLCAYPLCFLLFNVIYWPLYAGGY
ncbi:unnamed protein product [Schistocephalus solidus]|uniref:Neur_chan_LBD domain-containing protein n=1 Tax=Schistocephalus solidus TaxID=70667 RepID=A0A183TRD9_SCHSO|nr:unnamed protein product [Schistocephalus solidus]